MVCSKAYYECAATILIGCRDVVKTFNDLQIIFSVLLHIGILELFWALIQPITWRDLLWFQQEKVRRKEKANSPRSPFCPHFFSVMKKNEKA